MKMNVYNIVWADDDIEVILSDDKKIFLEKSGFNVVGIAHNGKELEDILDNHNNVDAVIIDANFNEDDDQVYDIHDTSGLDYARSLYSIKLKRKIPFFLYTARVDEMIFDRYKHTQFLDDFPRYKRWFNKCDNEFEDMLDEIKKAVDEINSPYYIVRNKFRYELDAASLLPGVEEFVTEFLVDDYTNKIEDMIEPFVRVRKTIEKIFGQCEKKGLIPPISNNTNGTSDYFKYGTYREKDDSTGKFKYLYKTLDKRLMPKPLALSLSYIVDVTQDASHCKNEMTLDVDLYFNETKDVLLLRSVMYILIDLIRWYSIVISKHQDSSVNECIFWEKCE